MNGSVEEQIHDYLGVHSTQIRLGLALISILVVVLGVGGNLIVLVGSAIFKSLQMDPNSVLVLEQIALADLFGTVLLFIPKFATLITQKWIFGELFCKLSIFKVTLLQTEQLFIALLSLYKVVSIEKPLHVHITRPKMRITVMVIWAVIFLLGCLTLTKHQGSFLVWYFSCTANIGQAVGMGSLILQFAAMGITVTANLYILYIATTKGFTAKAARTTTLVCWVFVVSYIPSTVYLIIRNFVKPPKWFVSLRTFVIAVNLVANPIIYSFTNIKFRYFLKMVFSLKWESPLDFSRSWNKLNNGENSHPILTN